MKHARPSTPELTMGVFGWLPVTAFAAFSLVAFRFVGFTGIDIGALVFQIALGVAVAHYLAPRKAARKPALIYSYAAQAGIVMVGSLMLTHAAAASGRPLVDAGLLRADRWLGYDWREYMSFFEGRPWLADALLLVYNTHILQPVVLAVVLVSTANAARMEKLVLVSIVSISVTAAVFALYPATSAWGHEGLTADQLRAFRFIAPRTVGWEADFLQIRDGLRVIPDSYVSGLVSFPSYHCVVAIAFLWAAWPVRGLRYILIMINAGMIAAIPLVGGHYIIDLFAGAAVALISIVFVERTYPIIVAWATGRRRMDATDPRLSSGAPALL